MWTVRGTFTRTDAFSPALERLFVMKDALARRLEEKDDEALGAQFDALEEQTAPPHFELLGEDGEAQDFGLLYVDATYAGFRLT
jgi:hypothetical protein